MLHEGDLLAERYQAQTRIHDEPALSLFEGEDLRSGKQVVLAALRGETALDPRVPAQLKRLTAAARPKGHPHVAGILTVEDSGVSKVVVYERPDGEMLDKLCRRRLLPQHLAIQIAVHVTEALAYLHTRGSVHGALAPHWIVVSENQGSAGVCVIGAGLALVQPRLGLTPASSAYAAPERKRGADPLPQSDVYSVGALLQQMITGEAPGSAIQPPPGATDPVQRLLRRCLAPKVEERMADAEHLLGVMKRDILHLAEAPAQPVEDDLPEPGQRLAEEALEVRLPSPSAVAPAEIPAAPSVHERKRTSPRTRTKAAPPSPGRAARPGTPGTRRTHPIVSLLFALVLPALVAWYPYRLYTHWVESAPADVSIPTIEGLSEADALDALKQHGLRLAIVDEVFDPEVPEGEVVWARPSAGSIVKEGRQIRARISRGRRAVTVPDITRLNLEAAEKRLEEVGLVAEVTTRAPSDVVAEDAVISQIPKAGRKLKEGGAVQLMVSEGEAEADANPEPLPSGELEAKAATVSFDVPQGPASQRVQIRVSDEVRKSVMVYDGLHEPGDHIQQRVEGQGETHIAVLLDEQVIKEQDL